MSGLYRLVYASKNLIVGTDADAKVQIDQILESSRRNNRRVGVTGALMFNGGAFAQVLEGPQRAVEDTFERIQRDIRHGDVTVLECGPVEARGFDSWSMAFVGQSVRGRTLWNTLAAESGFDLSRMSGDDVFAMLHNLVQEEEGITAKPATATVTEPGAPASGSRRPPERPVPARPAEPPREAAAPMGRPAAGSSRSERHTVVALAILKAALADERSRTSKLRAEVDELRVALSASRAELASLRAERDLWAERARLMAAALRDDPEEIRKVVQDVAEVMVRRAAAKGLARV
ncbi:MAG: BLUF domain-containing protein [Parafilimonas terrae]|nr:BLUF domain-containing protein [Parafilimonas terrae]